MNAGLSAYERVLVNHSSFTLKHVEVKGEKKKADQVLQFPKASACIDLKYGNIKLGLFLDDYFSSTIV